MTAPNLIPSPVVYKDIPGFPGYRVGDDGSVWSCRARRGALPDVWKRLRALPTPMGYVYYSLCRDRMAYKRIAHRLVLEAFVGPQPEGQETRHLNGIPSDNRLGNLCWGTPIENNADKVAHGTSNRGDRNSKAKLDEAQVREIRAMRAAGHKHRSIAAQFGVCVMTVSLIVNRKTWGHI